MKSIIAVLGVVFVFASATAEEISLTASDSAGQTSWNTGLHWNGSKAPVAGNDYVVSNGLLLRTPNDEQTKECPTFAGDSLTLKNGASLALKHDYTKETVCKHWILDNANINVAWGDADYVVRGDRMDVAGTNCFGVSCCSRYSWQRKSRRLWLKLPLYGGEDTVLKAQKSNDTWEDKCDYPARVKFCGDNSNYSGRFEISRINPTAGAAVGTEYMYAIDFGGDDIKATNKGASMCMGKGVTTGDYLTMDDKTILIARGLAFTERYPLKLKGDVWINLAMCGSSVLSGRRGNEAIWFGNGAKITGNGSSVISFKFGESFAGAVALGEVAIAGVSKMIIGENVTFRVYPGYNNPTLPLEVHSTFADEADGIGPVTLKDKGYLSPGYGWHGVGVLGMASLTMESGSYLLYSLSNSDSGFTNDFVRIAGDLTNSTGGRIKVCFDGLCTGLKPNDKIYLLSAANLGEEGVAAEDFEVDNSAWSNGDEKIDISPMPGTFAIEENEGTKFLTFTYTGLEVVELVGKDTKGNSCFAAASSSGGAAYWSNKAKPDSSRDYMLPNDTVLRVNWDNGSEHVFAGHSLTLLKGSDLGLDLTRATIGDLRLYGGSMIDARDQRYENNGQELTCNATISATQDNPVLIQNSRVDSGNPDRILTFRDAGTLKGNGDLRFYIDAGHADWEPQNVTHVRWDATEFTGGIQITGRCSKVCFKNERSMGGPAAEFRYDRLRLEGDGKLYVNGGYTMSDPTRGIYIGAGDSITGGTFWVDSGPFVVSNLISGSTIMRKRGSATMRLCCPTNSFSGQVAHKEGKLYICHKDTLAKAKYIQCYANGVWFIDTPDGMTVSSKNAFITSGDYENGKFKINLTAFDAIPANKTRTSVNIFRVKGAKAADLDAITAWINLVNLPTGWEVREYKGEEVDGELVVSANVYKPCGLSILIK